MKLILASFSSSSPMSFAISSSALTGMTALAESAVSLMSSLLMAMR